MRKISIAMAALFIAGFALSRARPAACEDDWTCDTTALLTSEGWGQTDDDAQFAAAASLLGACQDHSGGEQACCSSACWDAGRLGELSYYSCSGYGMMRVYNAPEPEPQPPYVPLVRGRVPVGG